MEGKVVSLLFFVNFYVFVAFQKILCYIEYVRNGSEYFCFQKLSSFNEDKGIVLQNNYVIKKPLSKAAIAQVRSAMTVPEHIRDQIGDDEIHLLAQALWDWWQHMKALKRYIVSLCDKALFHPTPVTVTECPEKFFLWSVRRLREGHRIVAVGDKNKTFEANPQDWFSYFTPTQAVA
ncbi:MAG: hypothetical protein A2648_01670 [Candidatus Lloydbacteria bacterium RIFCSPHIGHO2_01_FULL_41_20]|uniref:Uncharacterized protein n=1 Tax=Candidatus Lloydbacteria bacterium RIFCSPHIGHO2_01_FULL_41_20 TaxID=1798657 RepID=A0A1G2CUK2_9BACT|nr:MAG: hypothetical protein A2648_01670 [Candidatus Lloydbacteria bacterium RIFCSPHIGHO2_01_FULL_41_20]